MTGPGEAINDDVANVIIADCFVWSLSTAINISICMSISFIDDFVNGKPATGNIIYLPGSHFSVQA